MVGFKHGRKHGKPVLVVELAAVVVSVNGRHLNFLARLCLINLVRAVQGSDIRGGKTRERGGDEGIVRLPSGHLGIGQGDAFVGIILLLLACYPHLAGNKR